MYSLREQFILANGLEMKEMDGVSRSSQMVANMKENGRTIKLMEKGKFTILMEIFMKVHSKEFINNILGEWVDDKAEGYGIYTHHDGAQYEGQWKNDLQHGYGVEVLVNGTKYEGYYINGKKHGKGINTF